MYEVVPNGGVSACIDDADTTSDEEENSFASFASSSLQPCATCGSTHVALVERASCGCCCGQCGARNDPPTIAGSNHPQSIRHDYQSRGDLDEPARTQRHPQCCSRLGGQLDGDVPQVLVMDDERKDADACNGNGNEPSARPRNLEHEEHCCVGIGDRVDIEQIKLERHKARTKNVGVQTTHLSPYRLRFWPVTEQIKCVDASFMDVVKCCLRTLSQWFLSQVGLTCVLIVWALLGATAFYKAEGPREFEQAEQINRHKNDIAIDLATDLRQLTEGSESWPITIQKYLDKHESLLLQAVSSGYVEGGGSIWTYPGCVLFAVLLLTTLGFGAPVPRTPLGRGMAVLFSAVGIPLHFMLILNVSSLLAKRLQMLATIKPSATASTEANVIQDARTKRRLWYKWFPPVVAVLYYVLGVISFGVLRRRGVVECLMFALDFTESGGVANTAGHVRILYALYIEIAVILAATIMSMVQVAATNGVIDLGLRLGLLTNT